MLKFLQLPIALSTTIISSLSFFSTTGIAQADPLCFMVNSSGQVVSLDNLCQSEAQRQALKKGNLCQGAIDKDGFPLALYPDLDRLKTATYKAKQNVAKSKGSESQSTTALEDSVQAARENLMNNMMNKIPSYTRLQEIQSKLSALYSKEGENVDQKLVQKLTQEQTKIVNQMNNDSCYINVMQAVNKKMEELE